MNKLSDPMHFSNLKKIGESPAHLLASIGNDEDKAAYRVGRLTHCLVLGVQPGVKWDVYPGKRQGKVWDDFEAARPGVDIFTKTEHELAKAMAKAVMADPRAAPLFKGDFEVPVEWTYAGTGRRCATRGIDVLNRPFRYTLELKTAVSSEPERFQRDARRMVYHAQGSWFRDAAASLGVEVDDHYVVAVEKKAPHVVTTFRYTPRAILKGDKIIRAWMELLKGCEEANDFPGYAQYIVELDVPDDEEQLVYEDEDGETTEETKEETAA